MKKVFCFTILWMLVISSFAQIEGNVLDQKENGIANAVVTAIDTTGKIIVIDTSDQRGFYLLKELKPGKYKIETMASGYQISIKEEVEVPKEAATANNDYDTYYAIRIDMVLVKSKTP